MIEAAYSPSHVFDHITSQKENTIAVPAFRPGLSHNETEKNDPVRIGRIAHPFKKRLTGHRFT